MGIRAGQLNRRLTIQQRVAGQDTVGQLAITWNTIDTVWASIVPLSGRELERAQAIRPEISHEITIRYKTAYADPKTVDKYRGVYKSRVFDFHATMNPEEGNVAIIILASEGLNQG